MKGIFGYLNYLVPRTRHYILETLLKGLQRQEYRGYDSAGLAFDGKKLHESGPHSTRFVRGGDWMSCQVTYPKGEICFHTICMKRI